MSARDAMADRYARGVLRRDEVCRVLVGGEWVVCCVPFEEAWRRVDDAGARGADRATPFGLPGVGPVLVGDVVVQAMVMLTEPIVITEPDDELARYLADPEPPPAPGMEAGGR